MWASSWWDIIRGAKMTKFPSKGNARNDESVLTKIAKGIKDFSFAKLFSKYPFLVLFLTLVMAFAASWAGVSTHGFPEFQDPYLGFETRGTLIANRITALTNLRLENQKLGLIENFPGEKISGIEAVRRKRSVDLIRPFSYCPSTPILDYSRVAVEVKDGDLEGTNVVGKLCYYQKMLENADEYAYLCEKDEFSHCCPMWSLPNYIARHANKSDCMDLTMDDVVGYFDELRNCSSVSHPQDNSTWSSEPNHPCSYKEDLMEGLSYVLETQYSTTKRSNVTLLVLPVPKNHLMPPTLESYQETVRNIELPDNDKTIRLLGYDFGTRDETFKTLLVSDLRYVVLSSVVIFVEVWIYTKSFFVTIMSYLSLLLTLGVSYYVYHSVFCIPYFPFMNMLVTIIVLGIGIDGTLILNVAWRRCRSHLKDEEFNDELKLSIMRETLTETTSTLVITTLTTACAFYASLTSSVTAIKCFSIFAGTSIVISFVLIYFVVPTSLLASDITWNKFRKIFLNSDDPPSFSRARTWRDNLTLPASPVHKLKIKKRFATMIELLTVTRYSVFSFAVFTSGLIWSICIVFHSPGYQLPTSEQFQLLSSDHPMERYDRYVESVFQAGPDEIKYDNLTFYFVWGVKDVDNGNYLDPNDDGSLQFDLNFPLAEPDNQKWMRKFCNRLKKQSFYDLEANLKDGAKYDTCMIDSVVNWMNKRGCTGPVNSSISYEPCCKSSKFPYSREVFEKCIGHAVHASYKTMTSVFKPDVAGLKFFTTKSGKGAVWDGAVLSRKERSEDIENYEGKVAVYVIRMTTNTSYSLSYDRMKSIWKTVDDFFENARSKAPESLQGGFVVSSLFDFMDLQYSLQYDTGYSLMLSTFLCFVFILVTSRSLSVSIGAVICILTIVVVSTAILIEVFDWKLGVFEAIAVTVAVGLSDFSTHHSIEFAKRKSIAAMTSPTFYSATATVATGVAMMGFSEVLVYYQIGSFFLVLVITSWLYSVFFLTPMLMILDKAGTAILRVCQRWISSDAISTFFRKLLDRIRGGCCGSNRTIFPSSPRKKFASSSCNAISECAVIEGDEIYVITRSVPGSSQDLEKSTEMVETLKLLKKVGQETTV